MNANEEEFLPYDDDEAIKFIRNQIPQELKEKFSDDDLNYLIDLIYEFYEEKAFSTTTIQKSILTSTN